ncbi:MAG TPA: 2-amino-4-hydroxy-6-hydroxymethyldihydropteridine diphosphokinase [Flavobacteriales bacterium]|nr:2-amino-4-hydroxy-6-hydroxymethyldihydropteridine diphosphokinase [Flavobacteriales bacterium]
MPEQEVVLLLGADLGDPVRQSDSAQQAVGERIGHVLARSRDHWSKPWGFHADTLFLNRALLVSTPLEPAAVLRVCLNIEQEMGRQRDTDGHIISRLIDIDILLMGDAVIETPGLVVPHPRLHLRRFALAPLCDLLPDWEHPIERRTALVLLNALPRV